MRTSNTQDTPECQTKRTFKADSPTFSERNEPVPAEQFNYPPSVTQESARLDVARRVLQILGDARTPHAIGCRMVCFAFFCKALPEIETQADLAKHLGISEARVSQLLKETARSFPHLSE